jgi:hypothetical protein
MWVQRRYMHVSGITDAMFKGEYKEKEKELKKKNSEILAVSRAEDDECIDAQAVVEQHSNVQRKHIETLAALQGGLLKDLG